jgi:hypothetical protein
VVVGLWLSGVAGPAHSRDVVGGRWTDTLAAVATAAQAFHLAAAVSTSLLFMLPERLKRANNLRSTEWERPQIFVHTPTPSPRSDCTQQVM